jgi:hypothetical protein
LGDGLGVFDPAQNKNYLLNATSALVWQHCDGNTSPQQLTDLLVRKFNVAREQAEQLMQLALEELTKCNLLEAEVKRSLVVPQSSGLTRRQALTGFAAAGISAILLPVVAPVVAKADGGENKLIPVLNCVENNGNGTYTAQFGYFNTTNGYITVPIGQSKTQSNTFNPPPEDRGQPTEFEPGEHNNVFQVTFGRSQTITWVLQAPGDCVHQVEASDCSPGCAPTTTTAPPPPTTTVPPPPTTTAAPPPPTTTVGAP